MTAETELPRGVVGRCCYHDKCVWRARIIHAKLAALLLHRREVHETAPGAKPAALWRWALRYAAGRLAMLEPHEILRRHPPPVGVVEALAVAARVDDILDGYRVRLESRAAEMPETGWAYFSDETRCRSVLLVSPRYAELFAGDVRRHAPRVVFNVAFCDESSCYPAWRGVYPGRSLAGLPRAPELVHELVSRYGAWNFWDYVDTVAGADEAGVSVYPGRRWAKANLFFRVRSPAEHAVRLSHLQAAASAALDRILDEEVSGAGAEIDLDGLKKAVEKHVRARTLL